MRYTINAKLFNAVLSAQSIGDVRYFLNGFFLRADKPEIVATNGHFLCKAPIDKDEVQHVEDETIPKHIGDVRGWIFGGITKPLPRSADYVEIDTEAQEDLRLRVYGDRYKGPKYLSLHLIDGTFPDYERVIKNNAQGKETHTIGIDPEYLYRPIKWAGLKANTHGVQLVFDGPNSAIEVRFDGDLEPLHMTLMPRRI